MTVAEALWIAQAIIGGAGRLLGIAWTVLVPLGCIAAIFFKKITELAAEDVYKAAKRAVRRRFRAKAGK
jgi:hypothetical protein